MVNVFLFLVHACGEVYIVRKECSVSEATFEITRAHKKIIEFVEERKCILFIGAGVHVPPEELPYTYPEDHRPPLATKLATMLAEECDFEGTCPDESPRNLQRVALCFETAKALGRKSLVDALIKHLKKGKRPSPALKMLACLPFPIIVTTNYDLLLESAFNTCDQTKEPDIHIYSPCFDKPTEDVREDPSEERPLVFKMHGDLNRPESIVITDEDYITFVQRMSQKDSLHPIPQTIRYRMKQWPTLFIGYSLSDYNLRLLFRSLRWRIDPAKYPTSFAVDIWPDPLIKEVWQNERKLISFIVQDLWAFVPWLYKEIMGKDYQP